MVAKSTDLKNLEALYKQSGNQLVLLYGKLGCEKEVLISEFLKDKSNFYYRCRQASDKDQCSMMGMELEKQYGIRLQDHTYKEYFTRAKSSGPSKLVIVIDEAQYLMKKDPSFYEALVDLKNRKLNPAPVMVILTSSSLVWADANKELVDAAIKVENMSFLDIVRAFPNFTVADAVAVYGVLGGVPAYLTRWDSKKNFKTNICELVLTEGGYLFDKAQELISYELRELSVYNTILSTIASGKDKLNELFTETGFSRAKISVYMKNLAAFDIIKKQESFETGGWDNTKKGVYQISDPFVNFWYCFVYPNLSDLYRMSPSEFYDHYIARNLDAYLSRYFIEVCKEYLGLLGQMGQLPIPVTKMGSWHGKTGDIDIMAVTADRRNIVGLCNWEKPAMTGEMYEAFLETMKLAHVTAEHIYLFSARAFAPSLVDLAKSDSKVELIDMREL